ncbi:hypothetical protein HHK36_028694 [Tetracentron sinense]|uniref:DOG1 domain-containing protein n=1 Tax=Tetracentron sinense TaxID=13715 RepID=A0A834YFV6_TETSI|nr:hypothetical protein HHK36_028694 [Tetracentron sinense]
MAWRNTSTARIGRRKSSRLFKDYYAEWIETLKNTLLPLLRHSMSSSSSSSSLLSTHVEMLHHHFQSYYEALDLAASQDLSQLLYPDWRNSLEKPFLWLGDFHPNLFTNLLRSFLDDDSNNGGLAWKNPSKPLLNRVEQIECGLRLMVPALVARSRAAQAGFIDRVAVDWVRCQGRKEATKDFCGAVMAQMEELMIVFMDANRLRRSILTEIMGATDVYQAALYLQAFAQFLVGFRDAELLSEFERCKLPLS